MVRSTLSSEPLASSDHAADERANSRQRVASCRDLLVEQVPRVDHVGPHLQCHPHVDCAGHASQPHRVVKQRLAEPTGTSMGGRL